MAHDILELALDFHRSPSNYPDFSDPNKQIPEDIDELLELAINELRVRSKHFSGIQHNSPGLSDATQSLVKQVFFIPGGNCYRVLGLNPGAPQESIRKHYDLLVKFLHLATKYKGVQWDNNDYARINHAFNLLRDQEKQREYDKTLLASRQFSGQPALQNRKSKSLTSEHNFTSRIHQAYNRFKTSRKDIEGEHKKKIAIQQKTSQVTGNQQRPANAKAGEKLLHTFSNRSTVRTNSPDEDEMAKSHASHIVSNERVTPDINENKNDGRDREPVKILVAVEQDQVRDELCHILKGEFQCLETDSTKGARSLIQENNNLLLMITSLDLAKKDDYELIKQLRANPSQDKPMLPVIVLTSGEDAVEKQKAFAAGVNDFLGELTDATEILNRIRVHRKLARATKQLEDVAHEQTRIPSPQVQATEAPKLESPREELYDIEFPLNNRQPSHLTPMIRMGIATLAAVTIVAFLYLTQVGPEEKSASSIDRNISVLNEGDKTARGIKQESSPSHQSQVGLYGIIARDDSAPKEQAHVDSSNQSDTTPVHKTQTSEASSSRKTESLAMIAKVTSSVENVSEQIKSKANKESIDERSTELSSKVVETNKKQPTDKKTTRKPNAAENLSGSISVESKNNRQKASQTKITKQSQIDKSTSKSSKSGQRSDAGNKKSGKENRVANKTSKTKNTSKSESAINTTNRKNTTNVKSANSSPLTVAKESGIPAKQISAEARAIQLATTTAPITEKNSTVQAISQREIDVVLFEFIRTYESGDLEQFLGLFDDSIHTEDSTGKVQLRKDYENLFKITSTRRLDLIDLAWSRDDAGAQGKGRFEVKIQSKNDTETKIYKGTITIQLVKNQGGLLISQLKQSLAN